MQEQLNQMMTLALENADRQTTFLTYLLGGFVSLITLLLVIWTFFGLPAWRRLIQAPKELIGEAAASNYIARAISMCQQADSAKGKAEKTAAMDIALSYLQLAEARGKKTAILMNWRAYALRRIGDHEGALACAEAAAALAGDDQLEKGRAFYNASCYLMLLGREKESLGRLRAAIGCVRAYRLIAGSDSDFKKIRGKQDFKDIIS